MKTTPMGHQIIGRERLRENQSHFALGAEQGTGKTWMLLDDAEWQFEQGKIDGLLVFAPKGVHANWIRREIPTHLELRWRGAYYLSGASQRHNKTVQRVLEPERGHLSVLAMNIDAVNTPTGYKVAAQFLRNHKAMAVVDESGRIKTPTAKRSEKIVKLGGLAHTRRIASGTLIPNNPLDLFGQFEFLKPKGALLGTPSYRAFVAEFANVMPKESGFVRALINKNPHWTFRDQNGNAILDEQGLPKLKEWMLPQLLQKDAFGMPVFRNLDKLRAMLAPLVYRVLKKDCLDLPDKIYQTAYFEMGSKQRKTYESVREELRYERDSGHLDVFNSLTAQLKLRQAISGFLMLDGDRLDLIPAEENPRLAALRELLEDVEGKVIIWAMFRAEIEQICGLLRELGLSYVEYHGGTSDADREIAIDSIQTGDTRVFVGHPAAAGTGLTLTAAETSIYYSRDFNLDNRLQSEDRNHRIGTKNNVVYWDIVAADSIDEHVAAALQRKAEVASAVLDNL